MSMQRKGGSGLGEKKGQPPAGVSESIKLEKRLPKSSPCAPLEKKKLGKEEEKDAQAREEEEPCPLSAKEKEPTEQKPSRRETLHAAPLKAEVTRLCADEGGGGSRSTRSSGGEVIGVPMQERTVPGASDDSGCIVGSEIRHKGKRREGSARGTALAGSREENTGTYDSPRSSSRKGCRKVPIKRECFLPTDLRGEMYGQMQIIRSSKGKGWRV